MSKKSAIIYIYIFKSNIIKQHDIGIKNATWLMKQKSKAKMKN